MSKKVRLDRLLVDRGLAPSRLRARELIEAGVVRVDGVPVSRVAAQVDAERPVSVDHADHGWVGRGALKLLGALDAFAIDPTGWVCADLGASTGGFTEVLLRRGAERVYAIDVGRGLLHRRLVVDPRVVVMEGVNARYLTVGEPAPDGGASLPAPVDLVVGDLSFIGLDRVLPAVHTLLRPGGRAVLLVKPQFEVGRENLGSGGRVVDDGARRAAIARICAVAVDGGFHVVGGADSVLPGAKAGNVEHFVWLERAPAADG